VQCSPKGCPGHQRAPHAQCAPPVDARHQAWRASGSSPCAADQSAPPKQTPSLCCRCMQPALTTREAAARAGWAPNASGTLVGGGGRQGRRVMCTCIWWQGALHCVKLGMLCSLPASMHASCSSTLAQSHSLCVAASNLLRLWRKRSSSPSKSHASSHICACRVGEVCRGAQQAARAMRGVRCVLAVRSMGCGGAPWRHLKPERRCVWGPESEAQPGMTAVRSGRVVPAAGAPMRTHCTRAHAPARP
jgi:hypothetical protein